MNYACEERVHELRHDRFSYRQYPNQRDRTQSCNAIARISSLTDAHDAAAFIRPCTRQVIFFHILM